MTVWLGEVGRGGGGMPAASTYYCRLKSSTQQPKVIKDGFGGGITKGVQCVTIMCPNDELSWSMS